MNAHASDSRSRQTDLTSVVVCWFRLEFDFVITHTFGRYHILPSVVDHGTLHERWSHARQTLTHEDEIHTRASV